MADPVRLRDVLHSICACGSRAVIRYASGQHGVDHRAIQACRTCAPKARAWAARAGPVRETHLAPDEPPEAHEEELTTLF